MGRKMKDFNSPAAILAALLFIHPILSTATDLAIPSGDKGIVDQWIADNVKEYEERTAEIANGIDVNLELRVLKAENSTRIITVRQDGTGNFRTITDAINSIPMGNSRRTIIKIGAGVYYEMVTIDRSKPFVTFYGDPAAMPTITFNGTAAVYGTWKSATVSIESAYFVASNIIFENTAPRPVIGKDGTQAVAMRISGDKAAFYNCKFYGYQDTLCDDTGRHFFKDCLISGTIDFIFGDGRSIYLGCTLQSVSDGYAAITAQARSTINDTSGFSFVHCTINGTGDAYLGRAWRESSRVVFAYTYMGSVVDPKGWDDKGYVDRDSTVFYGEYKCMGPGAATDRRASYSRILTDDQAKPFLSMTFIRALTWLLPPPTL